MSDLANADARLHDDRDREITELRSRLAALEQSCIARQNALSNVIANIRASLDLDEIFRSTTEEVRQFLEADRVGIFRLFPESHNTEGEFIAENVAPGYDSALAAKVRDRCFGGDFAQDYVRGRVQAVGDIYNAGLSDCHLEILSRFQVRANLVVPLTKDRELWGLLCVHQCRSPRSWRESEVEFARQVALHLDVAILQAEMLARLRQQNQQQLQRIAANVPGVIYKFRIDADGSMSFPYFSPGNESFSELSPSEIERDAAYLIDRIHPEDRSQFDESIAQSAQTLQTWEWEGRMTLPSGTVRWMEARACPQRQTDGAIVWYGWFNDCTDQKAIEEERNILAAIVENSSDFIGISDLNGNPIYLNPAGCRMMGLSPDEDIARRHISEYFTAESYRQIQQQGFSIASQTGRWRADLQFRHFQTGEAIPIDYNLFEVVHPQTGRPLGLATITRDMTEYKRVERELQAAKDFLQLVIDTLPHLVFWKDRNSVYSGCNRRFARLAGLRNAQEIVGKTDYDLPWTAEETEWYRQYDRQVMDANQPQLHIIETQTLVDGRQIWIDTSKIPLHDEEGNVIGILGTYEDITERKRAEEELHQSRQLLRSVIDSIPQLVIWKDRNSVFLGGNQRIAAQAGLESVEELVGKTDYEMPWRDLADWYIACDRRVMDTNIAEFRITETLPQSDGSLSYIETNKIPLRDAEGNAIGLVATAEDITERKQAEEALQRALADLSAIIDNLADGLLVVDTEGRITRFNPALRSMFGVAEANLRDRTCLECGLSEVALLVERVQTTPSEQVLTAEIPLSGQHVGQALAKNVFKDAPEDENPWIGSVVLIRDVTVEKEVDRMKTDFISTVSHELRTPLTSVLGFAAIIQEKLEERVFPLLPEGDRKIQKHLRRVRQNLDIIISEAERLTALINDVLDIAKMEAGKVEWKMAPLSVEELLDRALAATSSLLDEKNLQIQREVEPDLPEIQGDRDRLIQVVINLLSNAIKFTDEGAVTCRVQRRGNEIYLSIRDTGIGIAPEDIDKVFDKFKQVGETLTDKPKGTGLGLPICQQIVEHHGGRIWVESQLGEGSTFAFALPVRDALESPTSDKQPQIDIAPLMHQLREHVTPASDTDTGKSRKTILVVDDDDHVRELLRQSLETQGYQVKQASDGVEAIKQVKRSRPDLIVLDVMMPYIDGFDVAAVLKNEPQTMGIPILVLSIVEDRERGFRVGVDRYLTKPIDRQGLLQEVGSLLSEGSSRKKVLVVDRDASTLKILTEVLEAQGYSVAEAATDRDCIDKALSLKPDIIAIDSGFSKQHDIVKTLRFEKGLENVLFVLLGDQNESM